MEGGSGGRATAEGEALVVPASLQELMALALGLLVLVGGVSFWNSQQLRAGTRLVEHTHAVERHIGRLQALAVDAETAARGYLLTGEAGFLPPGRRAADEAPVLLAELDRLTADNPRQRERLPGLRALVSRRLALSRDEERDADRARGPGGRDARLLDEGQRVTDAIRALAAAMDQEEERLLAERTAAVERRLRVGNGLAATGALLLVAAGALSLLALRREVGARDLAAQALRRSSAELQATLAALQRSNRDLEEFALVAAHDLQQPLRKIRLLGDQLADDATGAVDGAARDTLRRMAAAAGRGQQLVQGLLAYSRVATAAAGGAPTPPCAVDLERVAREVVSNLEARLARSGGTVTVEALPWIAGDPVQLRQLLQNLVDNGLKFQRPGVAPAVRVAARLLPGVEPQVELAVSDNGRGVEGGEDLFDLFVRRDEGDDLPGEGLGVGLAICRRIVERHGGTIACESRPGQGATFRVRLPLLPAVGAGTAG